MLLQVNPVRSIGELATIPSSKPETQRAIIAATLAKGKSIIYNDLRCLETTTMKEACKNVGAKIIEKDGFLEIEGVGNEINTSNKVIDALGSGLVFRVFTALTCFSTTPAVITGDAILRGRVMKPLFDALQTLGANIHCIADEHKAPVVNWGNGMRGGRCVIPGNVSSQFITAVMLAAPMAQEPTEIIIEGEILSKSYIRQTVDAMQMAGIKLEVSEDMACIVVYPGEYQASEYHISGDYTSSSYIIAAATMFKGNMILNNMKSGSLQGERAVLSVIQELGLKLEFNDEKAQLTIINDKDALEGDFEFDASDYPNIVPTLAVIGMYVKGTFRVIGGSITRLHKSPRIKAIVSELQKLGVDIEPLFRDGVYDGFEIHGKGSYEGDLELSSWGDHRIFMSLFAASLRCKNSNFIDGYADVICSFPDFFSEFSKLGVTFEEDAALKEA